MVEVYAGPKVEALIAFYKPILDVKLNFNSIIEQIDAFGHHAYSLFQAGDHRSIIEFNNYNPKYIGKSNEENIRSNPEKEDFLETTANCFSYKNYVQAKQDGNIPIDAPFEKAVDLLLAGDLGGLEHQIDADPTLITRNSQYAHKSGLIHYIGSNGVEFWRQIVPNNLVEILELLLNKGADPNMWNNIYGSPSTLKGLIETSVHPHKAGLTKKLLELL